MLNRKVPMDASHLLPLVTSDDTWLDPTKNSKIYCIYIILSTYMPSTVKIPMISTLTYCIKSIGSIIRSIGYNTSTCYMWKGYWGVLPSDIAQFIWPAVTYCKMMFDHHEKFNLLNIIHPYAMYWKALLPAFYTIINIFRIWLLVSSDKNDWVHLQAMYVKVSIIPTLR